MAGSKEIRNKIKSVQSTRKITKAMEMVAASKMKKAQDRMRATRPYVEKAFNIAMHIAKANTEYRHCKRSCIRVGRTDGLDRQFDGRRISRDRLRAKDPQDLGCCGRVHGQHIALMHMQPKQVR